MSPQAEQVWTALDDLSDPEIPVLTLRDLGILREVREDAQGQMEVVITPTYSGCPAISQIEDDIRATLARLGIAANVVTQLSPAWTTDWMSERGREKLREYGIAPPHKLAQPGSSVIHFQPRPPASDAIACPRCGSVHTVETSRFASTACKALYKCLDCKEPFDYFKPY